ncbi:hypothetical protein K491DRAFT_342989 [Lophiostoma macrostomum CBS 122681]|uniref:Rhodopsin domain-containing protein n=1 Tax=Lophiostoma macrostomum CBS 122681 TaxID=1314788 RepID=A0A6A6TBT6_9PLEO|nr:hypothetical protein K491DRAFT_342989 [Lophiostoma macrostomum CBS 122681]
MTSLYGPGKEQGQQDSCTGVATAFTIASIVIVGLRTYTRIAIVHSFGKDDLAMLSALVFTIGYLIAIWVLRENGMGFSGASLTPVQMVNLIRTTLAIQIMYYIIIFCIKLSILFLYLRFAAAKRFAHAVKGTIWLLAVFCIICVICCLTQCIPLHKMWDFTGTVAGTCINTTALFYSTSTFNIITDIWILILPIQTLLSIQRPRREKAGLIVVFGLGVFSCIASIVRLHSIRIYTESKDPFYDSVPINLWSMIEVNIGIWCASIPALKALISKAQRERTRSITGYKYHSRDKSGAKISAQKLGSRSDEGSNGTTNAPDHNDQGFALKSLPNGRIVQQPEPAARKTSHGSEELFFQPGADAKV